MHHEGPNLESELARTTAELEAANRKLKDCAALLANVQALAQLGTWEWDIISGACTWSDESLRIFGLPRQDPSPTHEAYLERVHPEDRPAVQAALDDSLKTRRPYVTEYRIVRPDGAERVVCSRGVVVANDAGEPVRMIGTGHDITERKRAEEECRRSQRLLERTFASLHNAVFVIEARTARILDCNPAASRIFGYSRQEILGQPASLLHVDEAALTEFRAQLRLAAETHGSLREFEFRMKRKDGSVFRSEHTVTPLEDERGQQTGWVSVVRDITARKRAEEALRESEARYRHLHETMVDAFASVSMDGKIREFNRAFQTMLGYSDEELKRLTYMDLTPARWHAFEAKIIEEQVLSRGHSDIYEKEYRRKDGTVFPIELRASLIRDAAGQPMLMWAIVRDITQRRQIEEALRESEQRYRTVLEDQTEVISRLRADGTFTYVNAVYCRFFGKLAEEFIGQRWEPVVVPEDVPRVKETLQTLSPSNPVIVIENRVYSGDGQVHWMQFVNRGFFDSKGRLTEIQAVGRDITAQRRAVEALRASETSFRVVADNTYDWEFWVGPDERFLYSSPSCERLTGHAPPEFLADPDLLLRLIHPEDRSRYRAHRRETCQERHVGEDEFRIVRPDGTVRWIGQACGPVFGEDGVYLGTRGSNRDITERKRAEEELLASREQLRALSVRLESLREEERTRIAREIHDELGQMLTGLKMDLHWAEDYLETMKRPPLNPVVEKLVAATELTDAIIIAIHRIASDLRPGVLDRLGLMMALRHAADRFEQRTGIACQLNLPPEPPELPPETVTAFFRIFEESLTNVARHAAASAVQVSFRTEAGWSLLEIQDNGQGISEAALKGLRSLGLLGISERAHLLGGTATFQRGAQGGTRVSVRLPAPTHPATSL